MQERHLANDVPLEGASDGVMNGHGCDDALTLASGQSLQQVVRQVDRHALIA